MWRKIQFTVILLLSTITVLCQPLKRKNIENLAALGHFWGILKYYHPEVVTGKFNWDTALVANFENVFYARDKEDLNRRLTRLIPGNVAPDKFKILYEYKKIPCLDWIEDTTVLTVQLRNYLSYLVANYKPTTNYYVQRAEKVGNPVFNNEIKYDVPKPSVEYRFLALCRFWNIINFYYPYRRFIPALWDSVLFKYIPRVINIDDEYRYYRTMEELGTQLNDGHGFISSKFINIYSNRRLLPLKITKIDNEYLISVVIDSLYLGRDGVLTGDKILKIDNASPKVWDEHYAKYQPASNQNYRNFKTAEWLSVVKTNPSEVIVYRYGDTLYRNIFTKSIPYVMVINPIKSFHFINDSVGYLHLGKLLSGEIDSIFEIASKTKYLICDCRNYPNWTVYPLSEKLLCERKMIARVCEPNYKQPGEIIWAEPMYAGKRNTQCYKGKIIVLVDERTMSQAELTVLAIQNASKVITIGRQTAGAVGDVSYLSIPGGITMSFSGLGYFYPDYLQIQQKGIIPDILVKETRSGIIAGKDEILERAMLYIQSGN